MERKDQFTTIAGGNRIAIRVDYQVCDRCGFRLMRVETTIIGDQHLILARCPICEQFAKDASGQIASSMHIEDRLRYFDVWLATHGLNRETLEYHYRLHADHFFDDNN